MPTTDTVRRLDILRRARAIAEAAAQANRALTDEEHRQFTELNAEADALGEGAAGTRTTQIGEYIASPAFARGRDPLRVDAAYLTAVQRELEQRAALTTSTFGAGREWGSNELDGPRWLVSAAGVPVQPASSIYAQFPKLTLPGVDAGVAEGVTLAEFAASTAGSVTMKRFGRFTDLTEESLIGADAGAIVGVHRVAIARDLDSALITSVNTDAGSAVAFVADVKGAIRKSIATVTDTTAGTPGQIVVLAHPDNVNLLEDVTSTGGRTVAEEFTRFAGALIYASSAVPTGFMLTANLAAGCRFFEARGLRTRTEDPVVKTSTLTVATDIIGGFGTGSVTGYVIKNDVVTP